MKVWNFIPAIKHVIRHQLVELSLCLSKKEVAKLLHVLHGRIFQTDKLVQVYIECRNQLKFHGRLFPINILTPLSLSMLSTFVILLDLILVIDPKLPRNRLTSSFRVSHLLYTCCCWDQSRGVIWNPTHNSMAEYSEKKKIKHLSPFGISRSLCETTLKSSQGKGHGTRYEQIVKRMGKVRHRILQTFSLQVGKHRKSTISI